MLIIRGQTHLCLNELGCPEHVSDETDILIVRDITSDLRHSTIAFLVNQLSLSLSHLLYWVSIDYIFGSNIQLKHISSAIYHHMPYCVSQTSFGHISINSLMILMVSMAIESPQKDLSINVSHVSRQSVLAKILGRSTGNHYGTVY